MIILADIGGTKMRMARARDAESFEEPLIFDTPSAYEAGLELIVHTARELSRGESIDTIVLGLPGILRADKRALHDAPHLSHWAHQELAADLEKALQTHVILENDTALVGLGEACFGGGKSGTIVAYITISTGVNGVRILDKAIDRSTYGFEIGRQILSIDTGVTLEKLISGTAIEQRFGMHPRDLGKEHFVWAELAEYLACGLYNTTLYWSPDTIVVGGSMCNEIGIPLDVTRTHLDTHLAAFPSTPTLAHATLGDVGGLYGALARARTQG